MNCRDQTDIRIIAICRAQRRRIGIHPRGNPQRKLKPGERILESHIATELGNSRAPVREALRQLESEGLLVSWPHRGTYVVQFSAQDAYEIYSLRAALEGFAVSLVAAKCNESVIARLQQSVDEMHRGAETSDLLRMTEADMRFHEILCQAAEHKRLFEVWMSMSMQIRAFVSIPDRQYLAPSDVVARHQAVVAAIRKRQPEEACQLLSSDIMEVGKHVAAQLSANAKVETPLHEGD